MSKSGEHFEKSQLRQEIIKGLLVLALLVLLMVWLAGGFIAKVQPGPPLAKPQPPKYATWKAERRTFPLVIEQTGTIRAQDEAQVSSRIMAQVKEIHVKEGDVVSGGGEGGDHPTILARLDDRDVQARLRQAEQQVSAMNKGLEAAEAKLGGAKAQLGAAAANREKSLSDFRRYEDLHRNQAATGQQLQHMRTQRDVADAHFAAARKDIQAGEGELERVRAQKEQSQAALAEARVMLSHATILAPFSGRVVKKLIDVGDMVAPGRPMFVIDTFQRPELHAFLTESLIPYLKPGKEIETHVDALNKTVMGTIREIAPQSDPNTRTVLVKVSLKPDPSLVNGLFARLRVVHGQYDALVVPVKSVREVGQLHLVEVADGEGYPQRRFVTLGKKQGDLVEVLSGISDGEDVIVP